MAFEPFVSVMCLVLLVKFVMRLSRSVPSLTICSLGVMCFLKLLRNIREVYQVIYLRCTVLLVDVNLLRMTRTNQEVYFTCIFHFKSGGRVGAPVYSWYRFSPTQKRYLIPFFPPEPVHIAWDGIIVWDIAGLMSI